MNTKEKERKYLETQRSLLALNAAFEAAKAGEVGAEFFVAVDEAINGAIQGINATSDENKRD